jgi:hypothetical protein
MIIIKKICFFISLLLSLCCFACAAPLITLPKDFEMSAQAIKDKIPLNAGLYLKPSFRNYTSKYGYTYMMGDALSSGCERMIRNIFQDVILIDEMDTNLSLRNIDVIVVPEVISISYYQLKAVEGYRTRQGFDRMTIRWDIVSPGGKNIYTTTIANELIYESIKSLIITEETGKERMLLLLNNQFRKAQDDIYLGGWWKKQWWRDPNQ